MPGHTLRLLKIFIALPGDVQLERERARDKVLSLRPLAHKHGYDLEAVTRNHAAIRRASCNRQGKTIKTSKNKLGSDDQQERKAFQSPSRRQAS